MSVNGDVQIPKNTETDDREDVRQTNETESDATNTVGSTGVKLRTGQTVTFTNRDDGTKHTARVLGRAGKAKGQYKNWYNVQYLEPNGSEGQKEALDMSQVDDLHTECENTDADVLITKDISFDAAKQQEIENWQNNNVYEEVTDKGQKGISTRWVCTLKETSNGIVPKARLVARGFEEVNIHELQKDSPTCASESLRLLLAVICQNKWKVNSMDIKSAFLQGMELSRDIYIRPPPEAGVDNALWNLRKDWTMDLQTLPSTGTKRSKNSC